MGCFVRGGKNGMGCYVRGDKNSMGCYVRGDKNCMGCFVRDGKSLWDVLSVVSKNGMGCFVPGCFVRLPVITVLIDGLINSMAQIQYKYKLSQKLGLALRKLNTCTD